ncbi:UNVERIFIED_CONTAM: hypothetical protein FKN15_071723 [Acipenser sinensis]
MAQHDFAPAWLNFPTPPSSTKLSLNCEKQPEPNVRLVNRSDVNHRRRNSSDGFESSNGRTGGGNFGRKEKNGWRGRNGSESVNSRGGYHGGNSRSRAGVFHSGKNQVLRESNSTRNENGKREERDARKQFEAEDFPSLNPESEREQNLSKSVAAGVWVEHPPNPKSRTSKMMVIKKVSKEDLSSGFPAAGPPHQQPTKNGTGLSVFKGLIPKPAAPPVKGSRSSSSSPLDKMTQPCLMKLTRVRSDKKSEFLKALKQDKVDEDDHGDRNQFKDDETLNMHNSNNSYRCRDENLNRYENEVPRVNGNFGRKEKNGWRGRNGFESVNSRGGYHGGNSRSRAGVFHSGKNQVLRESNSTRNENGKREERDARKQFEAEDFPSLNPESEREQNLSKSVAAGVWVEHPPNPKSRTSKMMVIKKVSKEDLSSGFPAAGPPHQQPTKNGTGLSVFKGLIPKPAAPPVKGSRSSSSSPVDKMTQPRLMKLTRVRSDKKSEFLKALKQDKVDEEDHADRNQFKDDKTLNMHNSNNSHRCRDENLNRYENEVPRVNGNALVIRSSTFPQADVLSSSLEAEHRLLKEMGWQEDSEHDETYAPLTEDEMREFQAISEQLQKNGLRKNGLSCDFKFGTWKNSTFKPTVDNDEAETSSSDTSDDDEITGSIPMRNLIEDTVYMFSCTCFDQDVILKSATISVDTGSSARATPGKAELATPGVCKQASPGDGEQASPGVGEQASPGDGKQASPGDGKQTSPGDGEQASPGVGEQTSPGVGEQASPGDGEQASPGDGKQTSPGDGEQASPGDGEQASPGVSEQASPGDGKQKSPGDGEQVSPGDGEQASPGVCEQASPGDGEQASPGDAGSAAPGFAGLAALGTAGGAGQATPGSEEQGRSGPAEGNGRSRPS